MPKGSLWVTVRRVGWPLQKSTAWHIGFNLVQVGICGVRFSIVLL